MVAAVMQVKCGLMDYGDARLAMRCMAMVLKESHPWVAAVTKVEMVRQGEAKVGLQDTL